MTLPTGQLALALAGALCGPAALRSVREPGAGARARTVLVFEHQSVGRLEVAVQAKDQRAQRAVRDLRADPAGFARLFALLAVVLQCDGEPGRLTYEAVHRLTHGPGSPGVDRSRLNRPVAELLYLLGAAALTWTPPTGRGKRAPAAELGPLLSVEEVNRKARTVRVAAAARPLLTHYSLRVTPAAFLVARPRGGRSRPPAPVLARLRLAALIAARFRHAQPQRTAFGTLLERFAWVTFDAPPSGAGAAEAAGRVLRPRLREAARVLAGELRDPTRYGAGLQHELVPCSRAALRSMFALGLAAEPASGEASEQDGAGERPPMQPTLEDSRLRAADAAPVFPPTRPAPEAQNEDAAAPDSLAYGQDEAADSLAGVQETSEHSRARGQHAQPDGTRADGQNGAKRETPDGPDARRHAREDAQLATVGVSELSDGRMLLEFANGFGVVLPAEIAAAAGLGDSLAGGQDGTPSLAVGSLASGQAFPRQRPRQAPNSLASGHESGPQFGSTAGLATPESSSDDSDRARGGRLPAPLAPHTAGPDLPPGARASPARPRADDYDEHPIDERRSA